MLDSIEARHARELAEQRHFAREMMADRGPYLTEDEATVIIPSPNYHPEFKRILRSYGFRFEPGLMPYWMRPTAQPQAGRRYTSAGWLEWARHHYAKAWPLWEPPES